MTSSQRTYGRKRKDEASEKFDALFSDHLIKKPITIEIGKYKKAKTDTGLTIASVRVKNGTGKSMNIGSAYMPSKKVLANTESKNNVDAYSYSSISKSKYDLLFKKNEKNASDKFDEIFGDEIKQVSPVVEQAKAKQISEFDDLFGFAEAPSATIAKKEKSDFNQTIIDIDRIPQLSHKKVNTLSGIRGASMSTVDGKVVLNIQKKAHSPKKHTCISPTKKQEVFPTFDDNTVSLKSHLDISADANVPVFNNNKKNNIVAKNSKPLFSKTMSGVTSNVDWKLKNSSISLTSGKVCIVI